MKQKTLTIIVPAFNEEKTVKELVKRVTLANVNGLKKEIIIVNDGSTDKTKQEITKAARKRKNIKVINKRKNEGKGSAIRSAIKKGTGDIYVIQDADLEYNPDEYQLLLEPILSKDADVVFGSRFVTTQPRRVLYYWHSLGNKFLTTVSNIFTDLNLTDMETCYKMFTKEVAKKINIKEERFGFEPEFTSKIAKNNFKIYEVGISYSGRNYNEGKKINWLDGVWAFWCIIKYNLINKE
jgi:glycosyltransferase involved in cell wall biosynthesis